MPKPSNRRGDTAPTSLANAAPVWSQSRLKMLSGVMLIAAAALLAYLPALNGEFIFDDDLLLTNNRLIAASDGLYRIWLTAEPVDYWPVTNTSFWIEWRLWGMNPTGYHVTNLVLHIASALLIWAILHKMSIPGAWLAALLFAVHPVNVESVAWISQRKNTLSMLFFLLAILWYLQADAGWGRWYALSLSAFTLAMLSKGSVAMLPLVLLLIVWWQRGSVSKRDLVRTAPFFLVAIVLAWVNVWFQTHGLDIEVRQASVAQRLLGAAAAVWFYLYKALAPVNLVFIYPQWDVQASELRWWLPLVAAVVVTVLLVWKRHTQWGRPLLFAWLFFCVALVPVIGFTDVGFMQHSLVADRYQHVAIIGVVALAAAGWSLWRKRAQGAPARRGSAAIATAALVTALLTLLSWNQSALYADPITLYEATLARNPDSYMLHNNLGAALASAGQPQKAMQHYQQALQSRPDNAGSHNNLGIAMFKSGRPEEAIQHFQEAVRLKPDYAEAHSNLGYYLTEMGRLQEGMASLEESLRLKPDYAKAHYNLGLAYVKAGQLQQAVNHFEQAIQFDNDYADAYNNLGNALSQTGRLSEAIENFEHVLRLRPDDAVAHNNLGNALAGLGRAREAIVHYEQALQLQPDYLLAWVNLADAYAQTGQISKAMNLAERALDLARSSGETNLAAQVEARLKKYRSLQSPGQGAAPQPDTSP